MTNTCIVTIVGKKCKVQMNTVLVYVNKKIQYGIKRMTFSMNAPNTQHEETIEEQFTKLYPNYDYSLESVSNEKDSRKKKRIKTGD